MRRIWVGFPRGEGRLSRNWSNMILVLAILVFAGSVAAPFYYLERLLPGDPAENRRWFRSWVIKGLAGPIAFWVVLNLDVLPGLPPILPQMLRAQASSGNWGWAFRALLASALFVIGTSWAAVTFAWFLALIGGREDIRTDLLGSCFVWSILMGPFALLIVAVGGWLATGLAATLWLLPIANAAVPLVARKKASPAYSRAIGRMKMGKFEDAEWEVLHELEKCEDDFDGWMMLAELYANHFGDLAGAERTIQDVCNSPNATPGQISVALHRLADWHLKLAEDPVAARRALEAICQEMPGTHLATMARHRINQLPATRQELRQQGKGRRIHLPALQDELQENAAAPESEASREQAAAQANQYVEKLKQDPDNVAAREELARLFAERLNRAELAIDQIELLLDMPGQTAQQAAAWLSLQAAWQLRYLHDQEAARKTLERLVFEHPQSAEAFAAQRRLKLMDVELKMRGIRRERKSIRA